MNPLYLLLEIAAGGLFAFAVWTALRGGRLPFLQLASAAGFGLLLEQGDQLIFETYHYNPDFILSLDRAPVAIGLTWALILIGAMRLTDALGVRRRYAPFVDSVLAISLDLGFDAVAIRMSLWTWRDTPLTEAWFGVPAGNFYTWLIIVFGFSLLTRWLRAETNGRRELEWLQLGVPIPAFAIVLTGLIPFILLKPIVDPSPGGGMVMFVITLAVFIGMAGYGVLTPHRGLPAGIRPAIDEVRLAFASRFAIHGFFLVAMFVLGLASQQPVLLLVSAGLLLAELPLARLVAARHARTEAIPAAEPAEPRSPATVTG